MTAASLAYLPLAAGSALLASAGRVLLWGTARYMRAPLANTGVLALVTLSAMAGSNALYLQQHEHPAPLFAPAAIREAALEPEPVIPAVRRRALEVVPPVAEESTGSLRAESDDDLIGNAEVSEMQRKLQALELYEGAVDGFFGPRTARAIKAFEERAGLTPKGELTRELLDAVRSAPMSMAEPEIEPLPTPDPLPRVNVPAVAAEPAVAEAAEEPAPSATTIERAMAVASAEAALEPLPAPEPLVVELDGTEPPLLRREIPETPQQAMDMAVETAGDAIETIIDGVQSITMTTRGEEGREAALVAPAGEPIGAAREAAPEPAGTLETASVEAPRVGVPLEDPEAIESEAPPEEIAVLDTDAKPEDLMPAFSVTDPVIVAKVQRGLASLGFLHGPADGVAGEATAKAIRNFEVYYNYKVTGRISPELLDLLVQNGASI
jgi:peptidoglycan hydrolase-like protein with peptidoglycan-binding domain